jgi:hypothetical protein
MSSIDTLRTALFGDPPSASTKPSREGVLAAVIELKAEALVDATAGSSGSAAAAAASAASASLYAAAAQASASGNLFANTSDPLSNGVVGLAMSANGTGGTNGTFTGTFTGGGGSGAQFQFVVASGAVVPASIVITNKGVGYTSTPTPVFTASSGLTGAAATVTTGPRTTSGDYFLVAGSGTTYATLYRNVSGVATAQGLAISTKAQIDNIATAFRDRLEPVARDSVSTVSNSTGSNVSLLFNGGGSIEDVKPVSTYMVGGLGSLNVGKYIAADGSIQTFSATNYVEYTLGGADIEIRITAELEYSAGVVAMVAFYNSAGTFISALNVSNGATQFIAGDVISIPTGAVKIRVSGNGFWPLDITAKRAFVTPFIGFTSDSFGGRNKYIAKVQPNASLVLQAPQVWDTFMAYGQSWECNSPSLGLQPQASYRGDGRALAFRRAGGYQEALPIIGVDLWPAYAADVINLTTDVGVEYNDTPWGSGGMIGFAAAWSYIYHSQKAGLPVNNVLAMGAPYPGVQMDKLLPGGTVSSTEHPWTTLLNFRAAATTVAAGYGKTSRVKAFGFTHAAYLDGEVDGNGVSDYYTALTSLKNAINAANFNGDGSIVPMFIDQTPAHSDGTKAMDNCLRQMDFALANSSQVYLIGPRYPYPYMDQLHHTGDGSFRVGWLRGYVAYLALARKFTWTPFRITSAVMDAGDILVTVSSPPGFGDVKIDTTGLVAAQLQNGFQLKRGGTSIALTNFRIDRRFIRMTPASAMTTGDEFSYAYRSGGAGQAGVVDSGGNGEVITAGWSGVRGNIKRVGPPTPAFVGETTDVWLASYKQIAP